MTESKDTDSKFLLEAARYFESRPTNGEDKAHWSNVYNAENCRRIAASLTHPEAQGNKDLGEPDLRSLVKQLTKALGELLEQIDCLDGIEYSRDVEPYKAEACWDDAVRRAQDALLQARSGGKDHG